MMQGSYGASLVVRALGTWALYNGLGVIIGGPERWGNPAYNIVNYMPGSPYTWGIILLIAGVLVMYGSLTAHNFETPNIFNKYVVDVNSKQIRNFGLKLMACWLFLFGIAFVVTIFTLPDVSYTFGSRDILIGVICVVMTKVREPRHAIYT